MNNICVKNALISRERKDNKGYLKLQKIFHSLKPVTKKNCSLCKNYKGDVKLLSNVLSLYS